MRGLPQVREYDSNLPWIVCVHGWCADGSYFDALRLEFTELPSVAVDLPAHGRSAWLGERSPSELGRALADTLSATSAPGFVLVGHGLGGAVALEAAGQTRQPVLGVVGLDCLHDLDRRLPEAEWQLLVQAYEEDFEGTLRRFCESATRSGVLRPDLARAVAEDLVLQDQETALAIFGELPRADLASAQRRAGVPILVLSSDSETELDLVGNRRGGAFEGRVIPGTGHFLHMERPRLLATEVQDFAAALVPQP